MEKLKVKNCLVKLRRISTSVRCQRSYRINACPQGQMLKLSSLSPDLERLNQLGYQLPLNDNEIKRLQNLNRSWSSNSARTIERFRYSISIDPQ